MWHLGTAWWAIIVRTAIIYLVFFLALRLSGKRELGQFTVFDLALVLLVANALQPAMTGSDQSVSGGADHHCHRFPAQSIDFAVAHALGAVSAGARV